MIKIPIGAITINYCLNSEIEREILSKIKFSKFEKLGEEINKKVDLVVVAVISKGIKWASIALSKVMKSSERLNLLKGWSQAIRRTLIQ